MEPTDGGATSPLDGSYGGKSPKHFIQKFCKLIYECPCPALGCEHIFLVWKKKFWQLLYLTQNWYCSRFEQRSENLVNNGNDNNDTYNQFQFEH